MASLATCSISGLPIREGDRIRFIPLKKNKYMEHHNYGILTPSLTYMNDMFNPLTLPITGYYAEYDNIENIIKDENTKAIEDYYGLSIDSLIKIINCSRTFNNNYSELLLHFGKEKDLRDDSYKNLGFDKKSRIDVNFNNKLEVYSHSHEKLKDVEFVYDKGNYNIYVYKNNTLIYEQRNQLTISRLLDITYKLFNIELNVIDDKSSIVEELKSISGMFVLDEIYQELVKNFKSDIEKTLIAFQPEFDSQMKEFKKQFDELNSYKEKIKELNEQDEYFQALKTLITNGEKSLKMIKRSFGHSCMYLDAFKHWEKLGDIYFELIINDSLKKDLDEFWFFQQGMYLLNKQFMPNLNSYRKAESNLMILNKITHDILKRRLTEQKIEEDKYQ